MTEDEFDLFFIELLGNIVKEAEESSDYIKDKKSLEYKEIKKELDGLCKKLNKIISKNQTIDDLAQMSASTIDLVYDYIANYAENFVIRKDPEFYEIDMAEYGKIEEVLDLFLDPDDFE